MADPTETTPSQGRPKPLDTDLAIIGAGAMGEALVKGILAGGALTHKQIVITDVRRDRLDELRERYQVDVTVDNLEAIDWADMVLIAVKPQQLDELFGELRRRLRPDHVLVSIVAGVSTERLRVLAGCDLGVVRVMPNSPALVGQGMAAVSPGEGVSEETVEEVKRLLSSVGDVVLVDESLQNAVTAISGSGPAYFFLMVEELTEAGVREGLDSDTARRLVNQTIAGSAAMLLATGRTPDDLRRMVTSPGGTTEAALKVFGRRRFASLVRQAVDAAVKRAVELSGRGK